MRATSALAAARSVKPNRAARGAAGLARSFLSQSFQLPFNCICGVSDVLHRFRKPLLRYIEFVGPVLNFMGLKKADSASVLRTPVGEIIWHAFSPSDAMWWRVNCRKLESAITVMNSPSGLRRTQSTETIVCGDRKSPRTKPGTPCRRAVTLALARLTLPRLLLTTLPGLLALLTWLLLPAAAVLTALATLTAVLAALATLLTTLVLLARLLFIRIHNCSLVDPPIRQQARPHQVPSHVSRLPHSPDAFTAVIRDLHERDDRRSLQRRYGTPRTIAAAIRCRG
jgi:hypothetical protein